jgi:hypothetical protein
MDGQNQLRREAVIQAYQGLRGGEREDVDFFAGELDIRMKSKAPYVRFSHSMAVELLGSIGILVCHVDEARQAIGRGDREGRGDRAPTCDT